MSDDYSNYDCFGHEDDDALCSRSFSEAVQDYVDCGGYDETITISYGKLAHDENGALIPFEGEDDGCFELESQGSITINLREWAKENDPDLADYIADLDADAQE
jgi:hypothetical protein